MQLVKWSVRFRYFKLGKLILEQVGDGLFQGDPLSVPLALAIGMQGEHSHRAIDANRIPDSIGERYVDDCHVAYVTPVSSDAIEAQLRSAES